MKTRPRYIVLAIPLFTGTLAHGAEDSKFMPSSLNFSVPASAALDILGVSPSKARSATSSQELALGLVNSFDQNGLLKNGFAFNVPVYRLSPFNLAKIQDNEGERRFRMTNVSIAAVRGTGDDKSGRVAASLSIPWIDKTDWRFDKKTLNDWAKAVNEITPRIVIVEPAGRYIARDLVDQWAEALKVDAPFLSGELAKLVTAAQQAILDNRLKLPANATVKYLRDTNDAAWKVIETAMTPVLVKGSDIQSAASKGLTAATAKKITERFNEEHWNDTKVDLSIAYAGFSEEADKTAVRGEGTYVSLALSDRLGTGQVTIVGRYATKDRSWDKDAKVWNIANSYSFGARFRGGSKNSGYFLEYLQTVAEPSGKSKQTNQIFQGGYEAKLNDGQWLQIALGQGSGGFSKTIFGLNLAFNLGSSRELDERGGSQAMVISAPEQLVTLPEGRHG